MVRRRHTSMAQELERGRLITESDWQPRERGRPLLDDPEPSEAEIEIAEAEEARRGVRRGEDY